MARTGAARIVAGEFDKCSGELVKVTVGRYGDTVTIDARVYLSENGADYILPTKKGLSLRPEKVRNLIGCLERALIEAEKLRAARAC